MEELRSALRGDNSWCTLPSLTMKEAKERGLLDRLFSVSILMMVDSFWPLTSLYCTNDKGMDRLFIEKSKNYTFRLGT